MNIDTAQLQGEDTTPERDQIANDERPEEKTEQPEKDTDAPFRVSKTPTELEKGKNEFQSFEASGNYANLQIFVQNLNYESAQQYRKVPASEKTKKAARFDLKKPADCAEFVEEYRNGEYLALAIALAVFDIVTINDLPDMTEKLIDFLPVVEEVDEKGNLVRPHNKEPYLSLQSKLAVIGAGAFVRRDEQHCVGFGSESKQILNNIWIQFPVLRIPIISWLISINRSYQYKTEFDAQQIIQAFSRVIALDFANAKKEIFPRLYSRPENMLFLGTLACALLKNPAVKGDALCLVQAWAESEKWPWKSALLAYAGLEAAEGYSEFKNLLQENIARHIGFFRESDIFFLSLALSCSVHARTMICEVLYQKLSDLASKKAGRDEIAEFYLMLVSCCYYRVNRKSPRLVLVACDTKEQQRLLTPVLAQVLSDRGNRKWLFSILELYLKEVSGYSAPEQLVKHTVAYFVNMVTSAPVYKEDISALLRRCSCSVAEEILKLLCL